MQFKRRKSGVAAFERESKFSAAVFAGSKDYLNTTDQAQMRGSPLEILFDVEAIAGITRSRRAE